MDRITRRTTRRQTCNHELQLAQRRKDAKNERGKIVGQNVDNVGSLAKDYISFPLSLSKSPVPSAQRLLLCGSVFQARCSELSLFQEFQHDMFPELC